MSPWRFWGDIFFKFQPNICIQLKSLSVKGFAKNVFYWLSHSFCSISLWWITLTSPLQGHYGNVPVVGGDIYELDPSNDAQLFLSPFNVLISMLNIAKTSAYIICKPIQLRSVLQFLSQCLSFNILICSSLIWDLQSICFVFPSMCSRNKHSFCILVILVHIVTQSLPGCYIGEIRSPQLTSLPWYGWHYIRRERERERERCSGNKGKWWGNPLTSVKPEHKAALSVCLVFWARAERAAHTLF